MTLSGLSRRTFLAGTGTLAAVAVTGLPAATTSHASPFTPALDPYAAQTWEPLVGKSLPVGSLRARLAGMDLQANGFQLVFESAADLFIEGIHSVRHPETGPVDLFLTSHGQRALAVFTHLPKGL